ncbi:dehydrase and lipid transport-domain-containing protein [Lipomyces oligophaga]|uniref:dehydrase and lipid transport-domain-containing protein n=1 Tax=Lipomyces oligophaga TaxID=45792 RepID=UPI0034CE80AE
MLRSFRPLLLIARTSIWNPARTRCFFTLPNIEIPVQTVSITRVLPYSPSLLYQVVSDVDQYKHFVPYCVESTVTERHPETKQPTKAVLGVGWKSFEESFESQLICLEPTSVIAESFKHSLFKVLYSRWQVSQASGPNQFSPQHGQLTLDLKFQFASPLYNAVSAKFAPAVAKIMIEAFESRMLQVHKIQQKRNCQSSKK